MRAIVAVDSALTLASVDEDESEAVALACVEFLLAETNAYYIQHVLARRTVQCLSDDLASNIMDAICAAVLHAESSLSTHHFDHEADPFANVADRHAVRTLPCRSPEKAGNSADASGALGRSTGGASSPSRDSRTSSSPEKLALHTSAAVVARGSAAHRTRRKADKGTETCASVALSSLLNYARQAQSVTQSLDAACYVAATATTAAVASAPTGAVDRQAYDALAVMPEILVLPEDADENPVRRAYHCFAVVKSLESLRLTLERTCACASRTRKRGEPRVSSSSRRRPRSCRRSPSGRP